MSNKTLPFVVATLALVLAPRAAQAQEIQLTGPLAGAPAVRQQRLHREGRLELAPTVSFTLLDEYRRTIFAGARLQYNVTDWLGVGIWGAYGAVQMDTDLSEKIDKNAPRNIDQTQTNLRPTEFAKQLSSMQWVAAPQVQLVPFRGKIAMFEKMFVDTDAYIHAGVAAVGLQERKSCGTAADCSKPESFNLDSRIAWAPTFGLGLNFYSSDHISFGIEYRAMPFSWNRAGFDTRGSGNDSNSPDSKVDDQDQTFKFNQMVSVSVGILLGDRKTTE